MVTTTDKFASPGEFLAAVKASSLRGPSQSIDKRLVPHPTRWNTAGSDEHGTYSDPHGGYLVPAEYSPGVETLDNIADPTGQFVRVVQASQPTVHIPTRFPQGDRETASGDGLTVKRRLETSTASTSVAKFAQITLSPRELGGYAYATNQLIKYSGAEFQQILATAFREEIAWRTLAERLSGTGVGEAQGVTDASATIVISKGGSQASDTITHSNIVDMISRCWKYENAIWLGNHDTISQLLNLYDAQNNPRWFGDMEWFYGRPIRFTEHAQTLGNQGDLVLGCWTEYVIAVIGGFQGEVSIHCRFIERESCFHFWLESDGAPWWQTPRTPANGTSTLSPFIVLEPR